MLEQRKYTRLVIKSMDIKCRMHFDTDVKLLNISSYGACISLNKQLKIGEEYTLNIESGDKTITVKGAVIWERIVKLQRDKHGGIKAPIYEVGIRFSDVLTDKGVNLLNFIDKNIFLKQSMVRLGGLRVKITSPKTSSFLDDHKSYSIIKLSLGGMLIEAEQQMKPESKFRMEMSIPKIKQPVQFLGRVASCIEMPDKSLRRYGLGIEFLKMSKKDRLRLNQFIKSLQNL